jgi:hypothetical protein
MKKLISFVLTLGFLVPFTMFAQVSGSNSIVVPEVVKNRLMSIWPQIQAVPVTWTMEGGNFKGEIVVLDKPAFALIDPVGKLLKVEKRLNAYYLPKEVSASLNKQFPENEILDIYELTDSNGIKTYNITYKVKTTSLFNSEGKVIQK